MRIQYQNEYLTIFESALYRTTCTWIRRPNYQLLIDPNYLPIELDFLEQQIKTDPRPLYLYFTHSDYDHIVGYSRFADSATVIASSQLSDHPEPSKAIQAIHDLDAEFYIERAETLTFPKVDIVPSERGYPFSIGNDRFRCYPAIGHNRDGLLLYHWDLKTLIVGDYLSALEFPLIYESFTNYISTIQILETIFSAFDIKLLVSGHGSATTDKAEMEKRLTMAWQYVVNLREHVLTQKPFPETQLWRDYRRSSFLEKMHQTNIKLVKKELLK
jgi:glyoxylase-like metal-dependent hydrolase (beta-lactamase superfamily II)